MKVRYFITLILPLTIHSLCAQVGIGTSLPEASAVLELKSSSKGFLTPRVYLLNAYDTVTVPSPVQGLLVFNTHGYIDNATPANSLSTGFYYYDGLKWVMMTDKANQVSIKSGNLNMFGDAIYDASSVGSAGFSVYDNGLHPFFSGSDNDAVTVLERKNNYTFIRDGRTLHSLLTLRNSTSASSAGFEGAIGIGTETPATSAILDVRSANRGFIPPRVSLKSTTDILTVPGPVEGLMVYNTNSSTPTTSINKVTPGYYYWDGSTWVRMLNQSPESVVNCSTTNPNTVGTVFTPNTPTSFNILYVASDKGLWLWNGTSYVSNTTIASTPFYIANGSATNLIDAGSAKTTPIYRIGSVGLGTNNPYGALATSDIAPTGMNGLSSSPNWALNWCIRSSYYAASIANDFVSTSFSHGSGLLIKVRSANYAVNALDVCQGGMTDLGGLNRSLLMVKGDGRVGVGTSTPFATLHVAGTTAFTVGTSGTTNTVIIQDGGTFATPAPATSSNAGLIYIIRNSSATNDLIVNNIVDYNSTVPANFTLTPAIGSITIVNAGTRWFRVQ